MQLTASFYPLAFFFLGACMASFAGVLAVRLHTGQGIVAGHSRCDACGALLSALALVPIVGALTGRARCCGARILLTSALFELVLGILFTLAYQALGLSLLLGIFLAFLLLLCALVQYDLAHQILPPVLLAPAIVLALAYAYLAAPANAAFLATLITAAVLAGIIFAIFAISGGRAMGSADAPLAFALALVAAPRAIAGFAFSFWIGAIVGIILVAATSRVRMKSEVPLAPFLAAGFLLAYFLPWDPFASIIALLAH